MKRFAFVLLLLAGPAWAQSAIELVPTTRIELSSGQSKVFETDKPFNDIKVEGGDIAKAFAHTDRRFSVTGLEPGETVLFVYSGAVEVMRATIVVGQEVGHIVRHYDQRSKDYTGYYCTTEFCGRADKELRGARDVSSITTVTPGGTAITRTFGGK